MHLRSYYQHARHASLTMQLLRDCFVRIKEGEWFCRAPCSFDGPTGLVTVTSGVVHRRGRLRDGLDLAALLEDWHATGQTPPNVSFR